MGLPAKREGEAKKRVENIALSREIIYSPQTK
jgi:hypothetical protein